MIIDVVLGLSRGDEGKGKVCHSMLGTGAYTHCIRFSGGGNAGHTIYHKGQKFVTHQIPAGVFYGVKSVIGPGCVVNPKKLLEEIAYLEQGGVPVKEYLKVAENAHVVLDGHIEEDSKDVTIGTTKTGNGPCYRDKYDRKGLRAAQHPILKEMAIGMFEEFYGSNEAPVVLAEGAQGFCLDVDWGDYPYVTSSHCGIGSILLNGFSHKQIRKVIGVVKAYDTYVGAAKFEPTDNPIFAEIRKLGQEYGATTGRPRQCNWFNLDEVTRALKMNGVDELVVNKIDILDTLGVWKLFHKGKLESFDSRLAFQYYLTQNLILSHPCKIIFSDNPHSI